MPALPVVPSVVKVELRYQDLHDANIINRFFVKYDTGTPTAGDMITFCTGVHAAYVSAACATWKSTQEKLVEVEAQDLSSPTGAVGNITVLEPGLSAGNPLGAQVAFLASFVIARRYRGGHPRMYISGPTSLSATDNETLTPAATTSLQTEWTNFFTAVQALPLGTSTGVTHVNVSYYAGFTNFTYPSGRTYPRPNIRPTPVTDTITGLIISNKYATQRRRLLRG